MFVFVIKGFIIIIIIVIIVIITTTTIYNWRRNTAVTQGRFTVN